MQPKCAKSVYSSSDGRQFVVFTDGTRMNMARLVGAIKIGRPLARGEIAHHMNGDRSDDRLQNIHVFGSQGDHMRWHSRNRRPPVHPKTATVSLFGLRMNGDLRAQIQESAARNRRSMNGEIIVLLERSLKGDQYRV